MLYHWVYHMKMECEVCECDLGSTQCWIWGHRCMEGAGCMLCYIQWYCMVLYPYFHHIQQKWGAISPAASISPGPSRTCAKGPTFHIEDRPNNLGSTWGSSPNEPGHCGPMDAQFGKKTDAAMPSLVWLCTKNERMPGQ
jgi:hypothetical protein